MIKNISKLLFCVLGITSIHAQQNPIPNQKLDTVVITSAGIRSVQEQLPRAVTVVNTDQLDAIRQQQSLQDFIQPVAGVFTQNATNFAQDLRISIRGFGTRSSFGIRGIKLIVDGIPETTPDGQGQLDNLNLGIIEELEVTKGASSSLYGNASGGVIAIRTREYDAAAGAFSNWKATYGSYGFQNYQATAGLGSEDANVIFHGNYARSNGYRDQSDFEQVNTNVKGFFRLRENVSLTTILNYANSPTGNDPGGLTAEELAEDRRQARQRNIDFKTGEAIKQFKIGTRLEWKKSKKTAIEGYAFYNNRQFDGRLPFEFGGVVVLSRNYMGQGTSLQYSSGNNQLKVGYDFGYQADARERFRNLEGNTGAQTLDQDERFTNLGVYAVNHLELGQWYITSGVRYDYNKLAAVDRFLENGDDSGDITLHAINPSLGVSYLVNSDTASGKRRSQNLFVNFSTSFETPSLSELSANPSGDQGFNEALEPQQAISLEIGNKGVIGLLQYNFTGFAIFTTDDLVPFEIADFPDREFYRNAGETLRRGIETEVKYTLTKAWQLSASYALSNFEYTEYVVNDTDFNGNKLAGIPQHAGAIGLAYDDGGDFRASVTTNMIGKQWADDANTTEVAGYTLVNLAASYDVFYKNTGIKPYLGIRNLLNQEYTDNVRINAFGGRYFEPAPTINFYGGVTLHF